MEIATYQIKGGVYLVIDPAIGLYAALTKVESALKGGVSALQIWNHWLPYQDKIEFINNICSLAHRYHVPVLINNDWRWLLTTSLDGVHFDAIPQHWNEITQSLQRPFLKGITCGNDPERIQWAIDHHVDYISFCSMFPSSSADVCELVSPDIVKETRAKTTIPIFAAGGINLENLPTLIPLEINGVALISAIMEAHDPENISKQFNQLISKQSQ